MKVKTGVTENKASYEGKRVRVPLGVPRMKLTSGHREGYVRRWINDDRLQSAEKGGYSYVRLEDAGEVGTFDVSQRNGLGDKVSRVVGRHQNGSPMMAYLMEIKQEWYDEDQRAKQAPIDEQEMAIKRGAGPGNQEGRYIPDVGIKITHGRK